MNKKEHIPSPKLKGIDLKVKTVIDYPKLEDETTNFCQPKGAEKQPLLVSKRFLVAQESIREVYMDEKIEKYILDIIFATRYPERYNLEDLKPLISSGLLLEVVLI